MQGFGQVGPHPPFRPRATHHAERTARRSVRAAEQTARVASSTASQWIGLVGVLAGVLASGIIGLATALLTHRWQRDGKREDRSREARVAQAELQREAYVSYLAAAEALENHVSSLAPKPGKDISTWLDESRNANPAVWDTADAARARARLVAGDEVLIGINQFEDEWLQCLVRWLAQVDSTALNGIDGLKDGLINAMRVEQADLLSGD
jgi:gas vesicle protein